MLLGLILAFKAGLGFVVGFKVDFKDFFLKFNKIL